MLDAICFDMITDLLFIDISNESSYSILSIILISDPISISNFLRRLKNSSSSLIILETIPF